MSEFFETFRQYLDKKNEDATSALTCDVEDICADGELEPKAYKTVRRVSSLAYLRRRSSTSTKRRGSLLFSHPNSIYGSFNSQMGPPDLNRLERAVMKKGKVTSPLVCIECEIKGGNTENGVIVSIKKWYRRGWER